MSRIPKILCGLSLFTLAVPAGSAEPEDHGHPVRSISVTGQGEAFGKPDVAEIDAGVLTSADTVVQASRANQAVVDRIFEALEAQGIAEKDVQTQNYSIWPEQDYRPREGDDKPRITGYRVSNTVHVRIREIERVGEVLAAVTDAGANSVGGIQFSVEDSDALEAQARQLAMADARARAESLAGLAGVELGDVLAISMSSAGLPRPYAAMMRMEAADAGAPVPGIATGQQSVSVSIDVTWAIR